jgi:hypothetical protein
MRVVKGYVETIHAFKTHPRSSPPLWLLPWRAIATILALTLPPGWHLPRAALLSVHDAKSPSSPSLGGVPQADEGQGLRRHPVVSPCQVSQLILFGPTLGFAPQQIDLFAPQQIDLAQPWCKLSVRVCDARAHLSEKPLPIFELDPHLATTLLYRRGRGYRLRGPPRFDFSLIVFQNVPGQAPETCGAPCNISQGSASRFLTAFRCSRPSRASVRLVHRGLRHARSQGGRGAPQRTWRGRIVFNRQRINLKTHTGAGEVRVCTAS